MNSSRAASRPVFATASGRSAKSAAISAADLRRRSALGASRRPARSSVVCSRRHANTSLTHRSAAVACSTPLVASNGSPRACAHATSVSFSTSSPGTRWRCNSTYNRSRPKIASNRAPASAAAASPAVRQARRRGPSSSPVSAIRPVLRSASSLHATLPSPFSARRFAVVSSAPIVW